MAIIRMVCVLLGVSAGFCAADTIVLNDRTRASVWLLDTAGRAISIRLTDGAAVRIDKKQLCTLIVSRSKTPCEKDTVPAAPLLPADALKKTIKRLPVSREHIAPRHGFIVMEIPLVSRSSQTAWPSFFSTLSAFLSKHSGKKLLVRSPAGFYLLSKADSAGRGGYRYGALAYELSHTAQERTRGIASFVSLDTAGNFVPANKTTVLNARETTTTVRFLVIDFNSGHIVFDAPLTASDKGLADLDLPGDKKSQTVSGNNSILSVENKLETMLKRQFK